MEIEPSFGGITVEDLDYELPPELIAQAPPANREDARLLRVDRQSGALRDLSILDFPELLNPGDLLVLNDTMVLPARLIARRATGGKVGGLFLATTNDRGSAAGGTSAWRVLLEGSSRLKIGEVLTVPPSLSTPTRAGAAAEPLRLTIIENTGPGEWIVTSDDPRPVEAILGDYGHTPLPPYIRRERTKGGSDLPEVSAASGQPASEESDERIDRERYQTVYAARPGAVAAPTAGLHLTEGILARVRERGIETAFVTLHVGVGTFKPISVDQLDDHIMHSEQYELSAATAEAINACRARGGRIVAVGTTTVRVLETIATNLRARDEGTEGRRDSESNNASDPGESAVSIDNRQSTIAGSPSSLRRFVASSLGSTSIFIRPPYHFRAVDALLTNFHLPRSTLLALVMAFAGIDAARRAYAHAISQRYRFYSYGDAMFIA